MLEEKKFFSRIAQWQTFVLDYKTLTNEWGSQSQTRSEVGVKVQGHGHFYGG